METRLIRTDDGSYTLFVPSLNEHYHSTFGAVRESLHIFIGAGLMACDHEAKTLSIFEVGFGTGLNAYLTLLESAKFVPAVHYTAIESDPVDITLISTLNYPELCGDKDAARYTGLHDTPWNCEIQVEELFFLHKIHRKIGECELPANEYDLVYFDAFGPDVQPELWTAEIFTKLFNSMKKGGILVTYSVKGTVKRALKSTGFTLEKLPGPPGKREILRATKT